MSICLQNLASIQPRTDRLKFGGMGYGPPPTPGVNRRKKYRSGSLLLTRGKASDEMALWSGPHEHADQTPGCDILSYVGFHEEADADRLQGRHARQARLVERDRAIDIDLEWLSVGFESPAEDRSVR